MQACFVATLRLFITENKKVENVERWYLEKQPRNLTQANLETYGFALVNIWIF